MATTCTYVNKSQKTNCRGILQNDPFKVKKYEIALHIIQEYRHYFF